MTKKFTFLLDPMNSQTMLGSLKNDFHSLIYQTPEKSVMKILLYPEGVQESDPHNPTTISREIGDQTLRRLKHANKLPKRSSCPTIKHAVRVSRAAVKALNRIVAFQVQKNVQEANAEPMTRNRSCSSGSRQGLLAIHRLQEESGDGTNTSKTSTDVEGVGSAGVNGGGDWRAGGRSICPDSAGRGGAGASWGGPGGLTSNWGDWGGGGSLTARGRGLGPHGDGDGEGTLCEGQGGGTSAGVALAVVGDDSWAWHIRGDG